MSENLYDALESCLVTLQRGDDVETCLARYPDLIHDLRPLLAAAVQAGSLAGVSIPAQAAARGKSHFLNRAAELRELSARRSSPARSASAFPSRLQRSLVVVFSSVLALAVLVLLTGAGLVYASSGSLPGDSLYAVKRSWEGLRLQLAANTEVRKGLEGRYEQRRIEEIGELFEKHRDEDVEFTGTVTGLEADRLVVAGLTILLTADTEIEGNLELGMRVEVEGETGTDGTIIGTEIKVLGQPAGQEEGGEGTENEPAETEESPGSGSSGGPGPGAQSFDLEGEITNLVGGSMTVDGVLITTDGATEVRGEIAEGVAVRVRGFISASGAYIATRVEVKDREHEEEEKGGESSGERTPEQEETEEEHEEGEEHSETGTPESEEESGGEGED
jgi:hypothetical protein